MGLLSFKPKQVAKRLLAPIPERTRDVIIMRFGLLGGEGKTLDAIGKQYGITRERVRQIETFGLAAIKKSDAFTKEMESLSELEKAVSGLGGIVSEEDLLAALSKDPNTQNHLLFSLLSAIHSFAQKKTMNSSIVGIRTARLQNRWRNLLKSSMTDFQTRISLLNRISSRVFWII